MFVAIVVACLVVVGGLVLLAWLTWRLWGLVKELGRAVGRTGQQLTEVTDQLSALQQARERQR